MPVLNPSLTACLPVHRFAMFCCCVNCGMIMKINTDYGVVSDYTDCLCAFFCYHAIATEMNLMFKGYIYGGCCGDADSQREIQQLTPTAKSPSEVSMN